MASKSSVPSSSGHASLSRHRRHHKLAGRLLLILHSLNVGFAVVSLAIFTAIIPIWNANFFHSTGVLRGDWPDALPIIPLSLAFISSSLFLIKLAFSQRSFVKAGDYLKSRQRPQDPLRTSKAALYLTLTTLILLLTFLILAGISGLYRFWRPAVITTSVELSSGSAEASTTLSTLSLRHLIRSVPDSVPDSVPANPSLIPPTNNPSAQNSKATFHSCTLANVFTRKCNPTLYLLGDLQIAAIVTGSTVWLLNLIILVLQVRDHQYQKRRHQRSLRAKAKAKLDLVENEMSQAEKGFLHVRKKIHHDRKKGHKNPCADAPLSITTTSHVTQPAPAYTPTGINARSAQSPVRPKQHYYNPNITPSRSRSVRQPGNESGASLDTSTQPTRNIVPARTTGHVVSTLRSQKQTPYSKAVDEARRKVKPAETMGDWLAGRY